MSTRPNELCTIWSLRRESMGTSYVRAEGEYIRVVLNGSTRLFIPRADARLLAKRINQCLDGTRKR